MIPYRPRPSLTPLTHLLRTARSASTSTSSSSSSSSSSRRPIESTTFSAKSSPREVYHRPETQRGMPVEGMRPTWAKSAKGLGSAQGQGQAFASSSNANINANASGAAREGDPEGERFAGPSRPRAVYERPGDRDLPTMSKRWPWVVALALLGLGWGAFVVHATNAERLASSIMKQVQFQLRHSDEVRQILGESVQLEPGFMGLLDPWISGSVNMLQGRVDLKFRVRGTAGAGTVYFTSIRPQQESTWRIVRFKVISDSGESLRLDDKIERGAVSVTAAHPTA